MSTAVRKGLAEGLAGAVIALACVPLWACSVPVFRYALERWDADPYEMTLFHRGELSAEQQALVDRLQSSRPGSEANVQWRLVDVTGDPDADSDGRLLQLWKSQSSPELPWLVVRSPATQKEVWSGKLTSLATERLFDSPMRQEIARRLLSGQTAVWVLLEGASYSSEEDAKATKEGAEGGDRSQDEAALALLKQRLAEEQAKLELPEIEEADIQNGLLDIDPEELKIAFTVLRLPQGDAREQTLRKMLLATEDDLGDFQQPMAFPIFGRGRVLYALVGEGINAENIHTACVELTGPCTCQIKAQNLGADLLMSVDWDRLVRPTADVEKPLPPLAGLAGLDGPLEELDEPKEKLDEPLEVGSGAGQISGKATDVNTPVAAHQVSSLDPPTGEPPLGVVAGDQKIENPLPRASEAPKAGKAPQARKEGPSPLMMGMLVLFGLGVIGIAGASLLLIRR